MIIQENLCRECFKKCFDGAASNQHIIVSKDKHECNYCRANDYVVIDYSRFGETRTSEDSRRFVPEVKKQKINPNYSIWKDEPLYVD